MPRLHLLLLLSTLGPRDTQAFTCTSRLCRPLPSSILVRTGPALLMQTPTPPAPPLTDLQRRAQEAAAAATAAAAEAEQAAAASAALRDSLKAKESEKAFAALDTNSDGVVTVVDLRQWLQSQVSRPVSEEAAQKIMQQFDTNKDGILQREELPPLSALKESLNTIWADERQTSVEEMKAGREEQQEADKEKRESAARTEVRESGKELSVGQRALSTLPYLFPLVDNADNAGDFLGRAGLPGQALAGAGHLLMEFPFGGLALFIFLSVLGDNKDFNKLLRFNLLQAVSIDVTALGLRLLVGISLGVFQATTQAMANEVAVVTVVDEVLIVSVLVAVSYCAVSSLLGAVPSKLPFVSENTENRMVRSMTKDPQEGGDDKPGPGGD